MFDLIVTEPFTQRLDAAGRVKVWKAGEHITDAGAVESLLAGGNPFHLVKVPTTREPVEPEAPSEPE